MHHSAGVHAQLYEWNCSALDTASNTFSLPDLEISNDYVSSIAVNVSISLTNIGYIYPVPSTLNCSGTVTEIQYCYFADGFGTGIFIFTLLTLEQSGLNFTITSQVDVQSTPTGQICTAGSPFVGINQYCCDTLTLDTMSHFNLPAGQFAFGIIPEFNMLSFSPAGFPSFLVEHFTFDMADEVNMPIIGMTYTLNETNRQTEQTLRLFKFLISKYIVQSWILNWSS